MRFDLTKSVCVLCFLVILLSCAPSQAQEIRKTINDYFRNPLKQYQPDDPETRSQAFKRQTGHWGLFYNCDGEEQKRYSPYICWKHQANCPLPQRDKFKRNVRRDTSRVAQRIADGSCECGNTGCNGFCDQGASGAAECGCADCLAKATHMEVPNNRFQASTGKRAGNSFAHQFVKTEGLMSHGQSVETARPPVNSRSVRSRQTAQQHRATQQKRSRLFGDAKPTTRARTNERAKYGSSPVTRSVSYSQGQPLVQSGARMLSQTGHNTVQGRSMGQPRQNTPECNCVECRFKRANSVASRPSSTRKTVR